MEKIWYLRFSSVLSSLINQPFGYLLNFAAGEENLPGVGLGSGLF